MVTLLKKADSKEKPIKQISTTILDIPLYPCKSLMYCYVYGEYVFDIRTLRLFFNVERFESYDESSIKDRFDQAADQIRLLLFHKNATLNEVLKNIFESKLNWR